MNNILTTILISLISGGFLAIVTKSIIGKRDHRFLRIFEFKQTRYKEIMILMWAAMNPNKFELAQLATYRPDIKNAENLDSVLNFELHVAMLFASDEVLNAIVIFLNKKNTENCAKVAKRMREDLYSKF